MRNGGRSREMSVLILLVHRVSAEGSAGARRETNTWPVLEELARNHPEVGIHFQGNDTPSLCVPNNQANLKIDAVVYNRKKDAESAIGQWFAQLMKPNPWYKDVVPDVCIIHRSD